VKFLISHAAWIPERRESLKRLAQQLGEDPMISESRGPEHSSIWARRAWEWGAQQDEHVCYLNDDVLVHPQLRKIVEAMIEAVPNEPLSLHTNHVSAPAQAMLGHHWARCYWYTGPAVVLSPERVRSLLAFVHAMPWSFLSRNNEDNTAIHWAWSEQRPFWLAIPAPVIHDTALRSTLGFDDHLGRVPSVPWNNVQWGRSDFTVPDWWRVSAPPPAIENPWAPAQLLEYVRRVHGEGRQLCVMCQQREGVVGNASARLCRTCAMQLYTMCTKAGQEEIKA